MGAVEWLVRRIGEFGRPKPLQVSAPILQTPPDMPPAPTPEVINIKGHPLEHYPKFDDFVFEWNTHARSDDRLGLHAAVQETQLNLKRGEHPQLASLQAEVQKLRLEQIRQQEIYQQSDDPRKVKFSPLKRANRTLRQRREELDRVSHQDAKSRQQNELRLAQATLSLVSLDEKFALTFLDEDELRFYLADRLRDDPPAQDSLLVKYFGRRRFRRDRFEGELLRFNFRFIALMHYYDNKQELEDDKLWAKADEAVQRQMRILL